MKVSTRGRYGVRFLMDLAEHEAEGNVTLKQVAKRQNISEKYLWHIVNRLKIAGIVRATLGARGGYTLAKPASAITLHDALVALEGDTYLTACLESPDVCEQSAKCASRDVWREVGEKIANVTKSITLSDMVDRKRSFADRIVIEYTI